MDRLYYLSNNRQDTNFISKPSFDTAHLVFVGQKDFELADNLRFHGTVFHGTVIKFSYNHGVDADGVLYLTPDLGIIYSKNTTWLTYRRLHSTNDSIEKRINQYIDHILSDTEFVTSGEDTPPPVTKTVKFTPPKTK